jgi:puromycin-sensitive aminopeptidase
MLEASMGEEAFRDGVRRYLRKHAYACASSDDLWGALGGGVPAMMDGWTRRTGWPVLHAKAAGKGMRVRQERFLLDRDPERSAEDPALWDLPVAWEGGSGRIAAREGELAAPPGSKLNAGQAGFYLVNYDAVGWKALAGRLASLPAPDRYGLQEDAYSLLRAGYLDPGTYLGLMGAYGAEDNPHVWAGVADGLAALSDVFHGEPAAAKLEGFARTLLQPAVGKAGWEERAGESSERILLRSTLIGAALRFGEPGTVAEAKRRFAGAAEGLPPNLRASIFHAAARHGEDSALDALIALYEKADLPEVKVQLLRAMGAFRREAPLRRAVAYALSDKVRLQDAMYVFSGVPIETKPAAWGLLKEHWGTIDARYGKSGLVGHFISAAASGIPREDHAADVEAFFKAHPAPYASEKIKQTLEGIRARARFRARNAAALARYFGV